MASHIPGEDRSVSIPLTHLIQRPDHAPSSSANHEDEPPTSENYRKRPSPSPSPSPSPPEKRISTAISLKGKDGTDWWMWELIGIVTSGLCLGAIIGVLHYVDGKKRPKLPQGVTINYIISWLATLAKSSMLIPISECLSQQKWIWFTERDRDLEDMEYFEEASRGPWGSFWLLFRLRARHLAVLGALVTLIALSYDSMVQGLVRPTYQSVMRNNDKTIVSTAEYYGNNSGPEASFVANFSSAPLPMKAATYAGLFDNTPVIRPYFNCPSNTCNWSNYFSLAICSACQNMTAQLHVNCNADTCNAKLPSGAALLGTSDNVMTTNSAATALYFKNASSIAHVLGLFQNIAAFDESNVGPDSHFQAAECVLYLCVRQYSSAVTNGKYREAILNTWPDLYSTVQNTTADKDDTLYFYEVKGKKYGMANDAFENISKYLDTLINGTVTGGPDPTFESDVLQPIWDRRSFVDPISNVSATMTKVIRDGNNTDANDIPMIGAQGKAGLTEIYIDVRWRWIVVPVALFVATVVQLVMTIIRTRRTGSGVWRSSSLALAFHGFDSEAGEISRRRLEAVKGSQRKGRGGRERRENEETLLDAAKGMKVRMVRMGDGNSKLVVERAGERDF